jgi:hypothetical protein
LPRNRDCGSQSAHGANVVFDLRHAFDQLAAQLRRQHGEPNPSGETLGQRSSMARRGQYPNNGSRLCGLDANCAFDLYP